MMETGKQILTMGWYDTERNILNDVAIKEDKTKYISRKHATLEKADGHWVIVDGQQMTGNDAQQWKSSLNGTYVNYNKIEKKNLEDGDIISVGDAILKFTKI